jgi:hypothetical protein
MTRANGGRPLDAATGGHAFGGHAAGGDAPADWGELVQVHNEYDVTQASRCLPMLTMHSAVTVHMGV